ncbi:hypothetical protein [Crossiella cryophila]|uniref:Lipoprotein n=1 Tax=Crossiella cryophila TaxID=43355 RepID=A0A7W7CCT3_9PSEU|nr:hypothetical protein [Crossiella cryophila]MBB4677179.1 hypothetical protein [Crossiella cryophila]
MRRHLTWPALLLLGACATTPTPVTTPSSAAPTSTTPAPSTDVADCFDGDCTITVTKDTAFPLDAKAMPLTEFVVTKLGPEGVECRLSASRGGAFTLTLLKPGQSAAAGFEDTVQTWVTLVSAGEGSVVLTLGHAAPK